jgi:hypothetical protein
VNETLPQGTRSPSIARGYVSIALAIGLSVVYCTAFFVRPQPSWPAALRDAMRYAPRCTFLVIDWGFQRLGMAPVRSELRAGAYFVLTAVVVPWIVMALLRRGRLSDIGFRRPNRYGWRLTAVAYLISLPFLLWMAGGAKFATQYLSELKRAGAVPFLVYYLVNMAGEHFLLHGVILAACRAGRRWPTPGPILPVTARGVRAFLQQLGLAQPTEDAKGPRRLTRWIGLPDGCVPPVLASATLFGLVHVGKDPRELLLSVPGGLALAYLAYRSNSWAIPFILHTATAGTALLILLAMQ